jgi:Family of unknown function (DUF6188)
VIRRDPELSTEIDELEVRFNRVVSVLLPQLLAHKFLDSLLAVDLLEVADRFREQLSGADTVPRKLTGKLYYVLTTLLIESEYAQNPEQVKDVAWQYHERLSNIFDRDDTWDGAAEPIFGLEVGTDVSGLIDTTLELVAVGQHQIRLHLSDRISISITGELSLTDATGQRTGYGRPADAAQALTDRLGLDVVSAAVDEPGVLKVQFADACRLDIYDSNERDKSYQITIGDKLIVV